MNREQLSNAGLWFGLGNMFVYGLMSVAAHYAVFAIDPLLFGGLITLFGSLPLLVQLWLQGSLRELTAPKLQLPLLAIAGLALISTALFFLGTFRTSAINTGLLVQVEPLYALALAALFLGERYRPVQILATMLMLAGALAVAYRQGLNWNSGDAMILLVPLFFQLAHIVAKKIMPRIKNVIVIPAARLFYGGLALSVIAILINPSALSALVVWRNWVIILIFAFIFRSLDLTLWYQMLRRWPLARATALLPVSLAVSFTGSLVFLGESANRFQAAGLVCILAGLVVLTLEPHRTRSTFAG